MPNINLRFSAQFVYSCVQLAEDIIWSSVRCANMANQINTKIFIESLLCVSDIIENFETDTV